MTRKGHLGVLWRLRDSKAHSVCLVQISHISFVFLTVFFLVCLFVSQKWPFAESLKNAAVSAKAEEGQTVKEMENLLKWMKDVKGQLADIGPISADSRILQEQSKQVDEIYRDVLDKEGDITILRCFIFFICITISVFFI